MKIQIAKKSLVTTSRMVFHKYHLKFELLIIFRRREIRRESCKKLIFGICVVCLKTLFLIYHAN